MEGEKKEKQDVMMTVKEAKTSFMWYPKFGHLEFNELHMLKMNNMGKYANLCIMQN